MSREVEQPVNWAGPWTRALIVIWLVLAGGMLIRAVVQPHRATTYHYYRNAGADWLAGRELYQDIGETCRYSPLVHGCLVPCAVLPDWLGETLWRLANYAVFFAGLFWWCRALLHAEWGDGQRALVLAAAIPLALGSLNNAQSNPMMTGAMLVAVTAISTNRWSLAALGLAVACLLKIYPIALVLLLLLVYPRQLTWRFLGFTMVGLVLPFLMREPGYVARQYGNWLTNLQVDDRSQMAMERAYRDLWLLIRHCHLPITFTAYHMIQILGAALAAGLVLLIRRRETPQLLSLNWVLGLAAIWMTLLGPATESPTYIVLGPTMGWALVRAWSGANRQVQRGLVAVSFGLFMAARLAGLIPNASAPFHALGPHPLAALLLGLALTIDLLRGVNVSVSNPVSTRASGKAA